MTRKGEVTLEYALVDGVSVAADTMRAIHPDDRPRAICPCCAERVAWKAGPEITPHVSHLADTQCALTNPETAEHYNAKAHMFVALQALSDINTQHQCCKCRQPVALKPWASGWHSVALEHRVGSRRPDIVLLDDRSDVIAAIEVKHSHAVDSKKAADLAALGVPWIEVTSEVARAWKATGPILTVNADQATLQRSQDLCRICELRRIEDQQWELRRQKLQHERDLQLVKQRQQEAERHRQQEEQQRQQEVMRSKQRRIVVKLATGLDWDECVALHRRLERSRERQVADYAKMPPRLRIALGASFPTDGGRGVVTYAKVGDGTQVHHDWVEASSWSHGNRIALINAIHRLDDISKGTRATFLTKDSFNEAMNRAFHYILHCINDLASYDRFKASHMMLVRGHFFTRPDLSDREAWDALERVQDAARKIRLQGECLPRAAGYDRVGAT